MTKAVVYRLVCCLIVCFVIDYIVDWIKICWFSPFSLTWDQPHILPTICYITLQNGKQKNEEINKQSENGGGGRDWVDGLVETFASLSFPQRVSECRWFWLTSRDTNGWTQMCLPNSTHPVTLYALFTALWAIQWTTKRNEKKGKGRLKVNRFLISKKSLFVWCDFFFFLLTFRFGLSIYPLQ